MLGAFHTTDRVSIFRGRFWFLSLLFRRRLSVRLPKLSIANDERDRSAIDHYEIAVDDTALVSVAISYRSTYRQVTDAAGPSVFFCSYCCSLLFRH